MRYTIIGYRPVISRLSGNFVFSPAAIWFFLLTANALVAISVVGAGDRDGLVLLNDGVVFAGGPHRHGLDDLLWRLGSESPSIMVSLSYSKCS